MGTRRFCGVGSPYEILLTFEIFADCQHFYGRSIGRHGGSMEPLEPPLATSLPV
jgi:hypothetical protein